MAFDVAQIKRGRDIDLCDGCRSLTSCTLRTIPSALLPQENLSMTELYE